MRSPLTARSSVWTALGVAFSLTGCGAAMEPALEPPVQDEVAFRGSRVRSFDRALPDVDAIGYEVELRVDEGARGQESYRASVAGTFVATRSLRSFALDLEGNTVEAVQVDGRDARYAHQGGKLTITLPRTLAAGRSFVATVRYRGALFQGTGADPNDFRAFGGLMVFQRNRAGRRIYTSMDWPAKARRWLPTRDHPRDGAMVAFKLTFPRAYTVIANGVREARRDNPDGTSTWQYVALEPMPTYAFHLAAYDAWDETEGTRVAGITPRYFTYPGDRSAAATIYRDVPAALEYFTANFGPYRWPTLAFLEEPIFGGGMENATVVSMDETLFRDPMGSRETAFHELAHHWSGDLVRIDGWNDFWLSEGFTEYLTRRFVAHHDGPAAGTRIWRETLAEALAAEGPAGSLHPLRPADPEADVLAIFDDISYKKGAWVLRMLERQLGEAALTSFLRRWFEGHRGGHVTTALFERELAAATGTELGPFFRQWVYGEYHPELRVESRYDAARRSVEITVEQLQNRGPADGFTFPLELDLARGAQHERATVTVQGRRATARVPVAFEPTRVTVDPDEWLYLTVACDARNPCRDGYRCSRSVCLP